MFLRSRLTLQPFKLYASKDFLLIQFSDEHLVIPKPTMSDVFETNFWKRSFRVKLQTTKDESVATPPSRQKLSRVQKMLCTSDSSLNFETFPILLVPLLPYAGWMLDVFITPAQLAEPSPCVVFKVCLLCFGGAKALPLPWVWKISWESCMH